MFQKDYWSMKDEALDRLATKYRIPSMSMPEGATNYGDAYFNREKVINANQE